MLGQAELPLARPGVVCSINSLARSDSNGHSSFLAQFEVILAPFSSLRRPFQAQQGARQPRDREAPSRDKYSRRSHPRRGQNGIQCASLTNEERRSCRRNKAGQLPEPGLGELGQAEAELGLGPSSCSARPSSPPARPGSTIFPFGCHAIVRLLQALNKAILAPFSSI